MSKNKTINIPGIILDELKERDYSNDSRFNIDRSKNKKRGKGPTLSRKEKRKQQRFEKKHKGSKHANTTNQETNDKIMKSYPRSPRQEPKVDQKRAQNNSQKKSAKKDFELPFSSDDELSSGDFDDFADSDLNKEELEQLRELEEGSGSESEENSEDELLSESEYSNSSDNDDKEISAAETMAKLKSLQQKKSESSDNKDKKAIKHRKRKIEEEEDIEFPMLPAERAALEKDEMEMQYYAKKLNLKGKVKKIKAKDEFDAIGGLLEGLDYFENYGNNDEEYGDLAMDAKSNGKDEVSDSEASSSDKEVSESQSDGENEEHVENPFSSDDELSSGDFDDFDEGDLNEEEWEQLRDLEGEDSSGRDDEHSDNDDTGKESKKKKKSKNERENPYAAPGSSVLGEYVAPSMRKMQLENSNDSPEMIEIRKKVKSALNKLSDTNISVIISSLDELFYKFPRQYVSEAITTQVLEIVGQNNKLFDTFIMNYAAVIYSLWELRGVEVGATFIQLIVERFMKDYNTEVIKIENSNEVIQTDDQNEEEKIARLSNKSCNNIITLIAYAYNFGLITCKLIYNFIQKFVSKPNEFSTELLLRIVSVSGPLLRGDDPSALKDIITSLLTNVKSMSTPGPRMKFLLDTMSDLKNNRLKPSILATSNKQLKKSLSSFLKKSTSSEPLQVSLDDIESVKTKGKWWLVGASWRGNLENAFEEARIQNPTNNSVNDKIIVEDTLLDDIPDWSEISKQQRMNTDVRRAIFISIMSAQDYMEAFTKLEKLNLKNKQILEIPKVIYHCLLTDSVNNGYNPYYALVATKLSEHHHNLLKSYQFLFWDIVKNFEDDGKDDFSDNDETDEDKQLMKTLAQGKFFGTLLSENILQLDIFKHVPIMGGLDSDGNLFIEVLFYQMLISIAKKSESKKKDDNGNKRYYYNKEFIRGMLLNSLKLENKGTILKSLRWFISKKFKYHAYLPKKSDAKAFERDSRRINWAVKEFVDLVTDELGNFDE
ncbi:hypothetical protein TPHA_0F00970 [Tetrapisispora phaffii CBS 4417]|uniref:MI domain-containing protein n=1 Tax=Tetrapisispora phaffii (strain ATCC 24235 / CBS 4417 / NBRC 1672 / NRRL Y-8282 / UCD 70-5) TaxID=1071381 RepID=G8BV01_TETPH|nr:hypothetical protein TPHA_0F00970 [Tetrapisispora phaffii CBS 4417]CCE63583.1 hypothetical protein TPHA_0F00970 [Tetrapisispora phaffii CBS 4417]